MRWVTRSHDRLNVCSFHLTYFSLIFEGLLQDMSTCDKTKVWSEDKIAYEPSTASCDCRTLNLKRLDPTSEWSSKLLVRALSSDMGIKEKVSLPHTILRRGSQLHHALQEISWNKSAVHGNKRYSGRKYQELSSKVIWQVIKTQDIKSWARARCLELTILSKYCFNKAEERRCIILYGSTYLGQLPSSTLVTCSPLHVRGFVRKYFY